MSKLRLCLVVEATTDVRIAEGLGARFDLTVVGRGHANGTIITHPVQLPLSITRGPSLRTSFASYLLKYLRRQRRDFDHVLVQGYGVAALAANITSRVTGVPTTMLVCSPVEAYYRCRREAAAPGKPFRVAEYALIRSVAKVNAKIGRHYVTLSRYLASVIQSHQAHHQPHVIPIYGVNTHAFRPPDRSRNEIRVELGLPTSGSLLFFSSRIAPEKDSETVLRAVHLLEQRGWDIWLINRSGGHNELAAAAARNGISHRVLTGDAVHPQKALPAFYQAADLCVQASREEGLGFSPLEALACATPVVATAVGGLTETIRNGETGWSYSVGNAEQLATAITFALDDRAESERRSDNGRTMVAAEYDETIVFDRFRDYAVQSDTDSNKSMCGNLSTKSKV